jgi:two-component system alkaline phosphatase synthesis response regulator PhoP
MDRKPKILLIDDDPDFIEVTSRVLQTRSYQVVVANNGEEGIRKVKDERPDLILLDIMMPEKDGYAVADAMSKDPTTAGIPILALTSVIESLGPPPFPFKVSEYLDKTTKPGDLLEKIEKHLKQHSFYTDQPNSRYIFP